MNVRVRIRANTMSVHQRQHRVSGSQRMLGQQSESTAQRVEHSCLHLDEVPGGDCSGRAVREVLVALRVDDQLLEQAVVESLGQRRQLAAATPAERAPT